MIDLSNNNISDINDNIQLLNIINKSEENKILNLDYNNIKSFDFSIIKDNYQEIHLSYNEIVDINLTNVKRDKIFLAHNKISDLVIHNLYCNHLDISNNTIENIIFIDCIINILDLNTNCIDSIKFINTKVKELDLSINKIKFLDSYPDTIEKISLFANKLIGVTDMPDTIKRIDVSDNKLKELTYISNNLVSLDISKNLLTDFNLSLIPESLTYFDITENNIKDNTIFDCLTIPNAMFDSDSESEPDPEPDSDSEHEPEPDSNHNFYSDYESKFDTELIPRQKIVNTNSYGTDKSFAHQFINENNYGEEIDKSSDSELSIKLSKRHMQTIDLSDDSEEWDDLDEDCNTSALPDTDSDETSDDESSYHESSDHESSDHETKINTLTQQLNNEKVEQFDNNIEENFSDDEISRALREYKENIKEHEFENIVHSRNNTNMISRDIFDFLKDDSSDDSDSDSDSCPIYVPYDLHFEIVI